ETCLSLHFYPIPSPALPLKGREIGTALPLKGREIGTALPFKGREAATTASITHYKPYRAIFPVESTASVSCLQPSCDE
ncbi:MAG: hypothetical protein Q8O31_01140, partial [Rhodocyclaceae bacterium]|nr:hypothetical protein [Rhodocyclaceae bacterium]